MALLAAIIHLVRLMADSIKTIMFSIGPIIYMKMVSWCVFYCNCINTWN